MASEPVPIFYDTDGLIVHKWRDGEGKLQDDGGDTAQREGWYWLGVWIRAHVLNDPWPVPRTLTFSDVLRLLEPAKDGVLYRHPKLSPWNNPYDEEFGFSRDQLIPLVAAMGVWGHTGELRRLWNALPQDPVLGTKHSFNGPWVEAFGVKLFRKGDVIGPMTINLFRRAWGEDPWPAGDHNGPGGEAELWANVDLRNKAAEKDPDNTGDDLNLIVMLLMSLLRFKSDVSADAVAKYKARPESFGSYLDSYQKQFGNDVPGGDSDEAKAQRKHRLDQGKANGWKREVPSVYGAVRWYHRPGIGANPMLAELYAPIIHAYFE